MNMEIDEDIHIYFLNERNLKLLCGNRKVISLEKLNGREKQVSRFVSLILRHKPEKIGIQLDEHGWADVNELIEGIRRAGRNIDFTLLEKIVAENDKQRFSFSEDKKKIRANHGHTVKVDLQLESCQPPEVLYHGTVETNKTSIEKKGLLKVNRIYVHLSPDIEMAEKVAARRDGQILIYSVAAGDMYRDGYIFHRSVNGVWLTDTVPAKYLHIFEENC